MAATIDDLLNELRLIGKVKKLVMTRIVNKQREKEDFLKSEKQYEEMLEQRKRTEIKKTNG